MSKKIQIGEEKESFWKKKYPIPTWLAIIVALITIISIGLNIYQGLINLPTNRVTIAEGPTADPHYNLSQIYLSKIKLNFDGRYSSYYIDWNVQDEFEKSAGFEQVEKCNKLGFMSKDKPTEDVDCKIKFGKYGNYKITINVYYVVDEVKIQDKKEKINWLINKGERSFPWTYTVYVKED